MPKQRHPVFVAVLALISVALSTARAWAGGAELMSAEASDFFERRVRPVLAEHCFACHAQDAKGELRLDSLAGIARGGASGSTIAPGDVEGSTLISAVRYESFEMPPTGPLPDPIVAELAQWVAMLDERFLAAAEQGEPVIEPVAAASEHWAFQPPHDMDPPLGAAGDARLGEIDRFIAAKLRDVDLEMAGQAAPRELLRRIFYDLTGLPPTAEQTTAFEADPSDAAYERIVDELLDSPQFGERWARHWLDLARYADTRGYVFMEERGYPNAWKYRDWVVGAFNSDMPYDKFIVAQLAGDQLDDPQVAPASGFLTLGRRFLNNQHDIIDDRIDVTTRGLLGLTVACARCHDHKYDAIPTADYYSLYGVFASTQETPRDDLPPALADKLQPVEPVVFQRGNPGTPGKRVPRRFLSCLSDGDAKPFEHGSGRLELARAIASADNPLTARVWANRVWMHLLGSGLVATPSDFGVRGEPPTHPELLDWLARTLVADNWSTKSLIRRIVISRTYRQSSRMSGDALALRGEAVDPENRLLWHAHRKRLDLEAFRDGLLAAAGALDLTIGGPPVSLTEASAPSRRSLYGFIERQNLPAFFRTFDFANPNTHTAVRAETLSPHQALYLLNSPLVQESACRLAERTANVETADGDPAESQRIRAARLFQLAFGREASAGEVEHALAFIVQPHDAVEDSLAGLHPWSYGWGAYDPASQHVDFHALPQFAGGVWQGGAALPDPDLGWVSLHAKGGHPGDRSRPAVLRFVSPDEGACVISGVLAHPADKGDGVRAQLVSGRRGLLGTWEVRHGQTTIKPAASDLAAGEELYFVVDCRANEAYDSFELTADIAVTTSGGRREVYRSAAGFHGPTPKPLDRWQQLAQVLLMSNEFMFVD